MAKVCSLYRGFVISKFFFTCFKITGVKKIFRYTEDFVIDEVRYIEDQLKATEIRSLFIRDNNQAHILALRNSINR